MTNEEVLRLVEGHRVTLDLLAKQNQTIKELSDALAEATQLLQIMRERLTLLTQEKEARDGQRKLH